MINISTFMTGTKFEDENYHKYDLREPPRRIIHPDRIKTVKSEHITDDWTKIPFYPTIQKKNEMIQKYGKSDAEKIIQYSYENSTDPTREILPPPPLQKNDNQELLKQIQKYNEAMRLMNSEQRIIPQNVNKFSPAYSRIIAVKPKATTSANIRLGGVYR
jgi:hypothetical protein